MRFIIVFGTLAIALPFVISQMTTNFGSAVSERFLERPTRNEAPRYTIPPEMPTGKMLDVGSLTDWVGERTSFARGYATRVIPLDILYLLALGIFLGMGSATLAGMIAWPRAFASPPSWVWWALPALYIFSDFVEDVLIFTMLNWPSTIQSLAFDTLSGLRSVKIGSLTLALAQVLLLGLLSYVWVA